MEALKEVLDSVYTTTEAVIQDSVRIRHSFLDVSDVL